MPAALQLAVVVAITAAAVQEKLIDAPVLDLLTVWETLRQSNPAELHPTSCQRTREKINYMAEMSLCVTDDFLPVFPLETSEKVTATNQDLFKHEKQKK